LYIDDVFPERSLDSAFITEGGELLYADDGAAGPRAQGTTTLQRHAELETTLLALGRWARCWGVRFSSSKSGYVWFYHPGRAADPVPQHRLLLQQAPSNTIETPHVEKSQSPGVWLHGSLPPDRHFAHVAAKCSSVSRMLRAIQAPDRPPGFETIRT